MGTIEENIRERNLFLRCIITGRVQGVFFRASTLEQARQLNIKGYAKNLSNGNVEVVACGNQEALEKLKQWLHQGPDSANVETISCTEMNKQQTQNIDTTTFKVL